MLNSSRHWRWTVDSADSVRFRHAAGVVGFFKQYFSFGSWAAVWSVQAWVVELIDAYFSTCFGAEISLKKKKKKNSESSLQLNGACVLTFRSTRFLWILCCCRCFSFIMPWSVERKKEWVYRDFWGEDWISELKAQTIFLKPLVLALTYLTFLTIWSVRPSLEPNLFVTLSNKISWNGKTHDWLKRNSCLLVNGRVITVVKHYRWIGHEIKQRSLSTYTWITVFRC